MKTNLFVLLAVLGIVWVTNSGFFPNDDSPRWSPDPKTRINSGVVFQEYTPLPYNDNNIPVVNEPQYLQTPQGVFIVNTQFRVHPITAATAHQTEVPITRHPTNQLIMFGSANTSRGGNFSTGWYVTTDGGTTWNGNDTLFNSAGSPVFNFGDPGPIIDGSGRFLNSYITLTGQMGASYSINNGTNWSNTVTFPGSSTSSDKNFSSTDDVSSSAFFNRSYTVYTEFGGAFTNRIVSTFTANQGVSWSNVAPVSPPPSANHFHQGADSKVGPNGQVYVVWSNGVLTNPFTEDSLGFARSNDGGVTWAISKNNAANVNGNRTFNMMNGIRVAGFPRIDVDRTCGPRAGWIYVTVGEKNPGVAGDISDIILYRSTDGGTTFSSGVRVNQDAFGNGRKQYMAAV
ncbi:MAG: sialidase family protein, partial [bacterium]